MNRELKYDIVSHAIKPCIHVCAFYVYIGECIITIILRINSLPVGEEKTLKIESPLSGKHLWTTSIPERRSFVFARPP